MFLAGYFIGASDRWPPTSRDGYERREGGREGGGTKEKKKKKEEELEREECAVYCTTNCA